jgi:hypothetical protein
MFYKALGYAVWKGAKWYVGRKVPTRKLLLGVGGAVALGVATVVAVGAKRDHHD